jgi:transposase
LDEQEKLRKENEKLRGRVDTIDRLLGVASDLLRGRVKTSSRAKTPRPPGTKTEEPDESSPEERLRGAKALRAMGLTAALVAAVVGTSRTTLARWQRRERRGDVLALRRGPERRAPVDDETAARVEDVVRDLEGLVGATAISRTVPDVSRRRAAAIKRDTLTTMERERRETTTRVVVVSPGILRGLDAMHVATTGGWRFLLVAGDGSVPFRTSADDVLHYDGVSVARALDRDFALHGPPLVLRLDRARSHDTPEVHEVLRAHGVLSLHGPPRCPRFYGQLERMNREQRAWLDAQGLLDPDALADARDRMLRALNASWRRRTLDFRTAEEVWRMRPPVLVDRAALRDEVADRAACIARHLDVRGAPADLAERLAIEQALSRRGLLRQEMGGWC